jgi:Asp-tRNA(Asn)/Glu-tRNA(Gln) amidotransferase A subunit family amidase
MEAAMPQLQAALSSGIITSKELVTAYLARIDACDQHGPALAISVVTTKRLTRLS